MKALMMLEDESPVRELLRHILTGWSLNVATNMEHALKLFIACDRQVDLLLADVTLPAGSGIQVALLLRSVLPALPVILTTRYPVSAWSVRDFLDLEKLGPPIEHAPLFPQRVNVEVAAMLAPDRIRMRVWERGIGITRACGSGACAVCVAGVLSGHTGRKILAHLPGGDLELHWADDGHVHMTGPAVEVFHGEWEY